MSYNSSMIRLHELDPALYAQDHNYLRIFSSSRLIQEIGALKPTFFRNDNTSICDSTPQNIIGNLLLIDVLPEIKRIYEESNSRLPISLSYPDTYHQSVFNNLGCLLKISKTNTVALSYVVPSVLIKRTIGIESGIVLQGDLTGSLVTLPDTNNMNPRQVYLKRIFNDSLLDRSTPRFPYLFTDDAYSAFGEPTDADKAALILFRSRYQDFINHLPPTVLTMRQAVCFALQTHGISIDESRFSFSLTKNDYSALSALNQLP